MSAQPLPAHLANLAFDRASDTLRAMGFRTGLMQSAAHDTINFLAGLGVSLEEGFAGRLQRAQPAAFRKVFSVCQRHIIIALYHWDEGNHDDKGRLILDPDLARRLQPNEQELAAHVISVKDLTKGQTATVALPHEITAS